ncbi:MAG: universal stress protein [Deltaproteobacteria bacterium]
MAAKNNKDFLRVLVPTDFSETSANAAEYALNIARQNKARLYVIHVIDTSDDPSGFYLPHLSYEKLNKEMREAALVMLSKFCAKHFKGFKNMETHVLIGEPYKEIVKVIKGFKIDLTVMGTMGRTGIDRFIFGSTTERVMKKAVCPILVVPGGR